MSNIESIKEKLAALLAKTTANGASEAEASAALEFATRLAAKYEVSLEDLKKDESALNINQRGVDHASATMHEVDTMLAVTIAKYTGTRCWSDHSKHVKQTVFFGADSDVELALFTRELLRVSMAYEYRIYREFLHEGRVTKGVRQSFMRGFAVRITERLNEFTRYKTQTKTGNDLVVLKNQLVQAEYNKLGLSLTRNKTARHKHDAAAYSEGGNSGNRANLGKATSYKTAGLLA